MLIDSRKSRHWFVQPTDHFSLAKNQIKSNKHLFFYLPARIKAFFLRRYRQFCSAEQDTDITNKHSETQVDRLHLLDQYLSNEAALLCNENMIKLFLLTIFKR
jgi:hypothetical protein